VSGGDRFRGLSLRAAADVGGVIGGILLAGVAGAAQAELAARVLPRLALTIPMESKLRQLLPNLGVMVRGFWTTATTAADSVTRMTRHGLPAYSTTSPARRV